MMEKETNSDSNQMAGWFVMKLKIPLYALFKERNDDFFLTKQTQYSGLPQPWKATAATQLTLPWQEGMPICENSPVFTVLIF